MNNPYSIHLENGRKALRQGHTDTAVRSYIEAAGLAPPDPAILNEIGTALAGLKQFRPARDIFAKAVTLEPNNPVAHAQFGSVLLALGEPAQAEKHLLIAEQAFPNDPGLQFRLAQARQFQRKITPALEAYRKATELGRTVSPDFHAQFATLLEVTNRLDELGQVLKSALDIFPEDARLNFLMAKLERRRGEHRSGLKRLAQLSLRATAPELHSLIHYEMGRIHDELEDSESAFVCFEKANKAQESVYAAGGFSNAQSTAHIQTMNTLDLDKVRGRIANSPPCEASSPVFLVGFPRSGTTLLHQILEAHPEVSVLEEHSIIYSIQKELGLHQQGYPDNLYSLDDGTIVSFRKRYLEAVSALSRKNRAALAIDKLPLNILNIPLIKVLFPHARIILALRHPCDSVLSCYMQRFTPNNYMANFLNLDTSTQFYSDVMSLFVRYTQGLSLDYYTVRYESIVNDLEGEARNILRFLGLPWNDSVLDYRKHALNQDIINTPSYHQVVRPLYTEAIERWRRYERFLTPFMDRLTPFCERFGYDA